MAAALYEAYKFLKLYYWLIPPVGKRAEKENKIISKYELKDISKEYEGLLQAESKVSLAKILDYFEPKIDTPQVKNKNTLEIIRNKFSYHHDFESIIKDLDRKLGECEPRLFLSDYDGNCHYEFSRNLSMLSLMYELNFLEKQYGEGLEKIIGESLEKATYFADFLNDFVLIFCKKYLNIDEIELKNLETIKILVPQLSNIKLHYFSIPDIGSKPDDVPGSF